jgi:hypothetical protein
MALYLVGEEHSAEMVSASEGILVERFRESRSHWCYVFEYPRWWLLNGLMSAVILNNALAQSIATDEIVGLYSASVQRLAKSSRNIDLTMEASSNANGYQSFRYFYEARWCQDNTGRLDVALKYGDLDKDGVRSGNVASRRSIYNDWTIEYRPSSKTGKSYPKASILNGKSRSPSIRAALHLAESLDGYFCHDQISIFDVLATSDTVSINEDPGVISGRDCVVIQAAGSHGEYTLWLDPGSGYLPRRVEVVKGVQDRFDRYGALSEIHPRDIGEAKQLSTIEWRFIMDDVEIEEIGGAFVITSAHVLDQSLLEDGVHLYEDVQIQVVSLDLAPDFDELGAFTPDLPDGTIVSTLDAGIPYVWQNNHLRPYVDLDAIETLDSSIDEIPAVLPTAGSSNLRNTGSTTTNPSDDVEVQSALALAPEAMSKAFVLGIFLLVAIMAYLIVVIATRYRKKKSKIR